ncbi:hypothetical protein C7B80_24875 [Cyanosarcina cf. burmensis CCALA 770]|nr:hypothetical protein C7B80_24875 [Cyanosarcina cf. burmensis CCALA 770]
MSQAKENELEQGIEIAPGVKYGGTEQLAVDKIEARMRLLAMPPEAAQRIVEQTLYPQYWDVRPEDIKWEESIPTNYGEDNDEAEANA